MSVEDPLEDISKDSVSTPAAVVDQTDSQNVLLAEPNADPGCKSQADSETQDFADSSQEEQEYSNFIESLKKNEPIASQPQNSPRKDSETQDFADSNQEEQEGFIESLKKSLKKNEPTQLRSSPRKKLANTKQEKQEDNNIMESLKKNESTQPQNSPRKDSETQDFTDSNQEEQEDFMKSLKKSLKKNEPTQLWNSPRKNSKTQDTKQEKQEDSNFMESLKKNEQPQNSSRKNSKTQDTKQEKQESLKKNEQPQNSPRKNSPRKKLANTNQEKQEDSNFMESLKKNEPLTSQPQNSPRKDPTQIKHQLLSRGSLILQRSKFSTKPLCSERALQTAKTSKPGILKPSSLSSPKKSAMPIDSWAGGSPAPVCHPIALPRIYSPSASPSAGILRKRRLSGGVLANSPSPPYKYRRVSFNDSVETKEIPSAQKRRHLGPRTIGKGRTKPVNRCLDMPYGQHAATANCEVTEEVDKFQTQESMEMSPSTQLTTDIPVFTQLVNCDHPVDCVLKGLTSSSWCTGLGQLLLSMQILTVGDLCKLSHQQVNQLPIKAPKLATFTEALKTFAEKLATDSQEEEVEDLNVTSTEPSTSHDLEVIVSENDNNPSENDNNPSENDNNPSENDNNPSENDNNPSENDNNPLENDNNPLENAAKQSLELEIPSNLEEYSVTSLLMFQSKICQLMTRVNTVLKDKCHSNGTTDPSDS